MEEFVSITTENGNIYKVSYGSKTLIGHTCDKYAQLETLLDEAVKKTEHYYNLCVKNGIITPKLTQDEINNAVSQSLLALTESVKTLTDKVDALSKGEYNELSTPNSKSKPKPKTVTESTGSIQDS